MKKLLTLLAVLICLFSNAQTLTQLRTSYCGYNAYSMAEFIAADSVSTSTNYEFRLVNSANSYTQTFINSSGYPYLALYLVSGMTYNTTFTVDVRWSGDNQATWSAYGPTCTVTSPATATTSIADCGIQPDGWNSLVHAFSYGGATHYSYKLENASLSYVQTFTKTNNNFICSQFTGLTANTVYTVSVAIEELGVWNPYGPACTITTPLAPTTSLTPTYCGSTATDYSQLIYAETNVGDSVRYRLTNSSLSYTQTFTKTNFNFILSQFSGLANSTTYSVDCGIRYNGTWGPYGTVCNLTTPAAPTTSLQSSDCNITATSFTNQLLHCVAVTGFQCYFYNFTDGVNTYTLEKCNNNNFNLSQLGGLALSTTYTVTVKVKFNGVYGPFGNACTVTTPATNVRIAHPVYPNPTRSISKVLVSNISSEPVHIIIIDRQGNEVEKNIFQDEVEVGKNLPAGIYKVIMRQGDNIQTETLLKND